MDKASLPALLFCAAAAAGTAHAQTAVRYVANIPGSCTAATINGENHLGDCRADHLVNAAYSNGRAMFAFNLGALLAFAGDREQQQSPDRYTLYVSNLNVAGDRLPATGTCTVLGQLKGKATITCQAKAAGNPAFEARIVYQASGAAQLMPGPGQ